MYIIFAFPDYSSEVIERHQNLFYWRLINLALEFDIHQQRVKTDPKGKSGETLHYTKPQKPLCRATEDQGRSSLRSICTANNVEFSFIKVAVRYIQYIACTVLIEMMQIV